MKISDKWQDYELIDATDGFRLERWDKVILVRPDPQIVWKTERKSNLWDKAHAIYHRSNTGGGSWEQKRSIPQKWKIKYGNLIFNISPTGFKHTGIFPEQACNWDEYSKLIKNEDREISVLNLFGYTGGATLACAEAGAKVCHVDASKGMVQWGKENAILSGLDKKPIRWLVDDCNKFVAREQRRGNKYEGIIMDPPSYGRGPDGEVWKLEDCIDELIKNCIDILSDKPLFFAINSYTSGVSPLVMKYILEERLVSKYGGKCDCNEICLPVTVTKGAIPCGSTAFWAK